ncbi:MAG: molybdopterin-guanine dinucleotide biosynthesis protein B [Desulfobulbales bacterium]|nr:molybdopterin-guanine dinucleotide biosynthesis protein B [Desulfobulbales bacterium]
MAPQIVALVGRPDSGKTTLLEKLIPELNRRGYRIGTVKHHVHRFEMDREGKDTWRHKQAGAHVVALSSPTGLGVIREVARDQAIEELLDRYYYDVDLVIAEGYKSSALPKIEIFRSEVHKTPLENRDQTWIAMVSDTETASDLPHLALTDIPAIADFLVDNFIAAPVRPTTTLLVDGKPVALNGFVESFLARTVAGMTASLKGCRNAGEITITIRPGPDDAER